MTIDISLTDRDMPSSQEFIDFLLRYADGELDTRKNWHDQLSERLNRNDAVIKGEMRKLGGEDMSRPLVANGISMSYELTMAILLGAVDKLQRVHDSFKYRFIVGIPRSGGSYLTKQLLKSTGYDPDSVPGLIVHDGFPKVWPYDLKAGANENTQAARFIAEYLVLSTLFFGRGEKTDGRVHVPKKDLNAAYYGALYRKVFGEHSDFLVTVRNPAASCISTYEKSGGLPAGDLFRDKRSNIEMFMERDLEYSTGRAAEGMKYFDVYLRYWENYYISMATSGLLAARNISILPYDRQSMMDQAREFGEQYDDTVEIEDFHVAEKRSLHPDWFDSAQHSMEKVASVWQGYGVQFPVAELGNGL